jgi:hypothetical protein
MFNVREVVAVFDTRISTSIPPAHRHLRSINGMVQVNWLPEDALFDFDRVEIVEAKELEVHKLCIKVQNDTDAFRQPRYRRMHCIVDPQCGLSQSDLNRLKGTFGTVVVQAIRESDEHMGRCNHDTTAT